MTYHNDINIIVLDSRGLASYGCQCSAIDMKVHLEFIIMQAVELIDIFCYYYSEEIVIDFPERLVSIVSLHFTSYYNKWTV